MLNEIFRLLMMIKDCDKSSYFMFVKDVRHERENYIMYKIIKINHNFFKNVIK